MVAGVAQVDAQVAVILHILLFHVHARQAGAVAQLRQFAFGELVNEQHHRRLTHLAVGNLPVRAHGCCTECGRPAIEQHEMGDLLA
ncbi:hypothetical protein D9M73_221420 [compost metagenome]